MASAEELPLAQASSTPMSSPPASPWPDPVDEPFPSWATGAAVGGVLIAPFISIIVALVMRSSEQRPSRRAFLKSWAIWSGAWLCTGWLLVIVLFAAASGASNSGVAGGKCKNGPDPFNPPSYVSGPDGKHWTAEVPCAGGGSITRPATKSETRFLNKH